MALKLGPHQRFQLAGALIELREQAKLSQAEVATRADVSKGTVARYESWRDTTAGIKSQTVRSIAEACDASPEAISTLVHLARSPDDPGWWSSHSSVPAWMDPLLAFEQWADTEHLYANGLIPGLLQTRDYNLATHQALEIRRSPEEIDGLVDARERRQTVLRKTPPLNIWAVLDEAVLHRVVGSREVMAAQMAHLLKLIELPHIEVQIMPFAAGATAAGTGHFLILGRDAGPSVIYVELRRRGLYLDGADDLSAYRLSFDFLRAQAASASESRAMLALRRQEFER
ncbi:helix-turn-helix transcriptional regulator [Streptomyces sp. SM12]|uniref:helix-turn-helix domain-containing protein n=1 Tax=Streptomyces sp. SM12 TaxID=1071602 RepID=UPI000CD5C2F7|nr:helix-turn-helix transcriptional regulator [Streptomyces sp. SM12]